MAAITAERLTKRFPNTNRNNDMVGVVTAGIQVLNAVKIWAGAMVSVTTAGYATNAAATSTLRTIGVAQVTRDNTSGAAGDLSVIVRAGVWQFVNNGTSIATKDIGSYAYVVDNQTVDLSSSSNTRPVAGIIRGVDADGVWVEFGTGGLAFPLQPADVPVQGGGAVRTVRGVETAAISLTNYTMAGTDLTFVATDRILLVNQASAPANGIYVVGANGSGSGGAGTATLTRPSDFATNLVIAGMTVEVSEGTSFANSIWELTTADSAIVVDTDTIAFEQISKASTAATIGNTFGKTATGRVGFQALNLAGGAGYISGILPLANGGTGTTTYQQGMHRSVRYVMTSNVAALATFTVAQDGVTGIAGDRVLLVNQTTGAENGIYILGTVGGGLAPLTRPTDYSVSNNIPAGLQVQVSEGTTGANSLWLITTTGAIVVDTTATVWACPQGNWYSMSGITTLGTSANPVAKFVAGLQLKAKTSGVFRVDVDIAFNGGTTGDVVTVALITDTAAAGLLASANKVLHGVKGVGTLVGTNSGDGETIDTNDGAALTFNGAAWSTAPIVQKSETFATLTGLLTAQASGHLKFSFHGIVHNAIGTTKTPFTIGNTVGFGVKFSATNTLTFATVSMSAQELPAG